jgi:hypothetical protein
VHLASKTARRPYLTGLIDSSLPAVGVDDSESLTKQAEAQVALDAERVRQQAAKDLQDARDVMEASLKITRDNVVEKARLLRLAKIEMGNVSDPNDIAGALRKATNALEAASAFATASNAVADATRKWHEYIRNQQPKVDAAVEFAARTASNEAGVALADAATQRAQIAQQYEAARARVPTPATAAAIAAENAALLDQQEKRDKQEAIDLAKRAQDAVNQRKKDKEDKEAQEKKDKEDKEAQEKKDKEDKEARAKLAVEAQAKADADRKLADEAAAKLAEIQKQQRLAKIESDRQEALNKVADIAKQARLAAEAKVSKAYAEEKERLAALAQQRAEDAKQAIILAELELAAEQEKKKTTLFTVIAISGAVLVGLVLLIRR